ncbi:MAG: ATP-binding cassette domain-containing protein [Streptosporangiales bacterium]|nr:ATP-binding cassette domain-containing protein [Streptosporangiales bacterium]
MIVTADGRTPVHDSPVVLAMRDIEKAFPGVRALRGVDLTVHAGEVHAILGENGAGKSTLMNVLSGVFADYGGTIEVDGEQAAIHHPRDAQALGVAMIHQELNLVPELSIADNIFLGRELRTARGTLDRTSMDARSRELLAELGLRLPPRRPVRQLKVAEQQLVEVAKALSLNVRVLVMDEPTSALADAEVRALFRVIRTLAARGAAVIYISHRLEELSEIADTVTVLRDGEYIGTREMAATTRSELISMMVGRPLGELFPRGDRRRGDGGPRLRVEHLSVDGDARVGRMPVRDVSLHVGAGEIVGIAGLMGAGRSEVLEAVYGAHPSGAVSGTMEIGGRPYRPTSPRRAIARGLALVAEDRKSQSLVLRATVRFNASLAALSSFSFGPFVNGRRERAGVDDMVTGLRVKARSTTAEVNTLSGGNQQKVVLAKCLLTEPVLLLMDEPTRGIDVGAKAEIYGLMNRLAAQGAGILMVSSELPELLNMCDRILVLCEGRLTGEFTHAEATQEKLLDAAMAREAVLTTPADPTTGERRSD